MLFSKSGAVIMISIPTFDVKTQKTLKIRYDSEKSLHNQKLTYNNFFFVFQPILMKLGEIVVQSLVTILITKIAFDTLLDYI